MLKINVNKMGRACSAHWGLEMDVRFQKEDVKEKRPLRRSRRRWEDKIKMDINEIGRKDMDWVHLGQVRGHWEALVNTVM
jgi:hypothetical protein